MTSADVLIIDDDPIVREVAKLHLERAGYSVRLAGDGTAGLLAARTRKPGVVLLDFAMPGLSGVDVLRELKAGEDTAGIPVLMITAWRAAADRAESEELGARWLPKPIVGDTLVKAVESALAPGSA
jgi:DNA-binding response OmpR family regulator